LQHVRHAGRTTQVVLEHVDLSVAVADEIRAGDVTPDAARRLQPDTLLAEADGRFQNLGRHDAVLDDPLVVIHVVDEEIQRVDALLQAALDVAPLRCGDDTRNEIERKDALGAGAIAIDVERDPHVQQRAFGGPLPPEQLSVGEGFNELRQRPCR
jgi:hypothetical protein